MKKPALSLIIGLGQTGFSFIRYAEKHQLDFVVWDTREHPPLESALSSEIKAYYGKMDPKILSQVTQVFLSPGVPRALPEIAALIEQGVPVFSDLELFAASVKTPYVAITGSNGKTTVTTLVTEVIKAAGLKARAIGNIGDPVLDCLADREQDWLVVEASSFQLESTSHFAPKVAAVLNVSDNHMDRYEGLEEYAKVKRQIYVGAKKVVYHRGDVHTHPPHPERAWSFGVDEPKSEREFGVILFRNLAYLCKGREKLLPVKDLGLQGSHHLENALAILAISDALGLPMASTLKVLKHFKGLPHRCQWIREHAGITWYNDSKGTNVSATIAAIRTTADQISGKVVLLAGGVGKNADFTQLTQVIRENVRSLIVFGESARQLERIFKPLLPVHRVKTLADAIEQASLDALRGDAVLLSPACASTDMFKHYEDRGEQFVALCQAL